MLNTLSHPKPFYWLCLSEVWERFSFYATRSLLVLYLTKILLFSNQRAYSLFAAFAALLYLTPIIGGYLADRLLGTRHAIILGGILSAIGYALLAIPINNCLYMGLALIIIGNGFFIPNIANAVGHLYQKNDACHESAFTLFYSAINIGALLPPLVISEIIRFSNWHTVFLISAFSISIGTLIFYFKNPRDTTMVEIPHPYLSVTKLMQWLLLCLGLVICIGIFTYLLNFPHIANISLFVISSGFIIYTLKKGFEFQIEERKRLFICLLLTAFSVLFWVLSEQAAMSLTIFTEYNVTREIGAVTIPTVMFQALNPLTIILLGPLLGQLWVKLEKHQLNPTIPTKFALGTILIGLGFSLLYLAILYAHDGKIAFYWLVLSYVLQSIGELLVSPVGLSMITQLSPRKVVGLMMGTWYFATAVANSLAGIAASFTTHPENINSPLVTTPIFGHVFNVLGLIAIVSGVIALFFTPALKRGIGK